MGSHADVRLSARGITSSKMIKLVGGVLRPFIKRTASGIRVFCYHGVVERKVDARLERNFHLLSDFKRHINFFRRFKVIGINQITEVLTSSKLERAPLIAITFDDGYANNLMAAEVLDKAGLPWSVFVSTGAVGPARYIWTVELSLLILHGRAEYIEVFNSRFGLISREEREAAFQQIRFALKGMSSQKRIELMNHIRQQFPDGEIDFLLEKFPSFRMLSWKQLRQLKPSKVTVGSHGVAHEIHHSNQNQDVRNLELQRSKLELERELARPCNYFAFPNGNFHESSPDELQSAGYELAFTMEVGMVERGTNKYLLPRITPPASMASLKQTFYTGAT
jgi:peptidoglycan/xylan/chitin deacetylase (PgdA/CDA1 family)